MCNGYRSTLINLFHKEKDNGSIRSKNNSKSHRHKLGLNISPSTFL